MPSLNLFGQEQSIAAQHCAFFLDLSLIIGLRNIPGNLKGCLFLTLVSVLSICVCAHLMTIGTKFSVEGSMGDSNVYG